LRRPSEYSGSLLAPLRRRSGASSFRIGCSSRVHGPLRYRSYWFARSHFAVGPSLGRVVFPQLAAIGSLSSTNRGPLVEFRLRLESYPAIPSRSAAADQLLSWTSASLQHFQIRGSTCRGVSTPAMVRLQGLVTLLTAYAPRTLASLVSCRQRSWDSPFGAFPSRKVSARFRVERTHMPFLLRVQPTPKRRAGSASRGSWALALARVPGEPPSV
jgi:hypothetical protein